MKTCVNQYSLFKINTVIIVTMKNINGQPDESLIANTTVKINIITSIIKLHTIRTVRFPLKYNSRNSNFNLI